MVSERNCEAYGTSKRTELRSTRIFETHGTSKGTELRSARNFENVFEALMYLIIPEPINSLHTVGPKQYRRPCPILYSKTIPKKGIG